jgi:hypothetical protein
VVPKGQESNKPTHRIKIAGAAKPDGGKSFWTTIGSAWLRDDGTVSMNINDGVQLLVTKQVRIMLAPVEER